jgi:hypothetical protein
VILNETPNIWRDYGNWILPGLALIVIQGFLIAGLLDCWIAARATQSISC